MKTGNFSALAIGSIAALGFVTSCGNPPANTTASTAETVAIASPTAEAATMATSTAVIAQAREPGVFYQENGLAIRGTDPVAYFQEGKPVAGKPQFKYQWGNATWRFSSAENRDLFASNPEKYAPQYGGFCAWAVSEGYTAPIDPDAWKIVDSKLYLNYDKRVQRSWERDIPGHIAKANRNWPNLLDELRNK